MNVRRVATEHGSHIEPPLDETWTDQQKLEWHAAAASADTGLRVLVHPIDRKPWGKHYSIQVGHSSMSAMSFDRAWTYINGVSIGGEQVRRQLAD